MRLKTNATYRYSDLNHPPRDFRAKRAILARGNFFALVSEPQNSRYGVDIRIQGKYFVPSMPVSKLEL